MKRLSLIELFLLEICVFLVFWLVHHYVASLISLIIPAISLSVLILSLIFDLIEPSRIPRWYYGYLVVTVIAPLLVAIVFLSMNNFEIPWLEN